MTKVCPWWSNDSTMVYIFNELLIQSVQLPEQSLSINSVLSTLCLELTTHIKLFTGLLIYSYFD